MKSIENTRQITRAMEAVSATKMRRSQEFALIARPYAESALRMLGNVSEKISRKLHPLLEKRRDGKTCLVVITSDKGLCGGYNGAVLRKAHEFINNSKSDIDIIVVGKKARDYFKFRNYKIAGEFIGFGDFVRMDETLPISERILQDWQNENYSRVFCAYTNFISTLRQEAVIRQVLPVTKKRIEEIVAGIMPERGKYAGQDTKYEIPAKKYEYKYLFEPSREKVLNELLPLLVKIKIHHMILEANASEHSARMVAMKNASENAEEILGELNLFYNKARQALITEQIAEVTAGREALE
jgi:F-type H+-transporting ATPase subunit gamma